jgi:PAS domain S-box-containing protein
MDLSNHAIDDRAHTFWRANGKPHGTELEDWLKARPKSARALLQTMEEGPHRGPADLVRALLDNSPAAIHVKDSHGRYLLVNARFESLYKVSRDRLQDLSDDDFCRPDRAAAHRAIDRQVIATGRPVEVEEVMPDAEAPGEDRTYSSLIFPIAGSDESPYAVCGLCTDITERARARRCLVIQHAVTCALADAATSADGGAGILRAVCEALGWDVGLCWRLDPSANHLRCTEVWHTPGYPSEALERISRGMALARGVGLAGQVWKTGQPVWVNDIVLADGFPRAAAALLGGLHGACGFPVRDGDVLWGVIEFFSREARRPDPELVRVMMDVGSQFNQFTQRRQSQRAAHERDREFSLARAIQFELLPKRSPLWAGFTIGGVSCPAQETGGDYYDYVPLEDGSLGLVIGDASGHGIGAALVIAETRAYLRARAATDTDVGRTLTEVNRHLVGDMPEGHFVTLFLGRLDVRTRTLTYSSAGHVPGYVLDDRGDVREVLGSTNFPLGIDPTADYRRAPEVVLRPGEIVLLLTDGIVEAINAAGEQFGRERAVAAVQTCHRETPDGIVTALLRAVRAFSPVPQADDMTAVVLKVDAEPVPGCGRHESNGSGMGAGPRAQTAPSDSPRLTAEVGEGANGSVRAQPAGNTIPPETVLR